VTHELVLLAALFKPHMHCTWKEPGKAAEAFLSDNAPTPGGTLLYQRNFFTDFEEIIVYAYDATHHRYIRTQLSNDGSAAAAVSGGPRNGVWRFSALSVAGSKGPAISWERSGSVSRYWYDGVAGMGECR
jgi:hypothetical protein